MEEGKNELIEELVEEGQENLSAEEGKLLLDYTTKFINEEMENIVFYCYGWNGTNGISYRSELPVDLVYKNLERINEGRRICYTKTFKHYRGSVYYHVKHELLTFFKCRRKDDLTEDSPENFFTESKAETFFEDGVYADGAEDVLSGIERNERREAIFALFDPNDDIEEISVLEEYFLNKKREEIAESLKITTDEVTNIQKRINRRIEKYFNKNLL